MSENDCFLPINLPSKCLPYDGISPDSIKVRAYQGKDEIYLSQINPLTLERNYIQVLKNTVQGIDPENLTLGDRLYIIIWECINSYTDILKLKTVCTFCLNEIEIGVDLKELEIAFLPDNYKQPYEIILPESGKKINLRLLTVKDEIDTEKYEQSHKDAFLYRYARSIVNDDLDIIQKLELLGNLPGKDLATIRAFHEKFYHGPILFTNFKCPRCKEEDKTEVPFLLDLLFPSGETLTKTFGAGI